MKSIGIFKLGSRNSGRTDGAKRNLRSAFIFAFVIVAALRVAKAPAEELPGIYSLDRSKPPAVDIWSREDTRYYTKIILSYPSPNGGIVPAELLLPHAQTVRPMHAERDSVAKAYPVVFFMHFHFADKSLVEMFQGMARAGIAMFAIDGVYVGDRLNRHNNILMKDPRKTAENMKDQIRDMLRGIDVISSFPGLDPQRIGFLGISMGAITGSVATALDPRVKVVVLADGAGSFPTIITTTRYKPARKLLKYFEKSNISVPELKSMFRDADPVTFAADFGDRPVLMLNGKRDKFLTSDAINELFKAMPPKNKEIVWFNSGHLLPFEPLYRDSLDWFRAYL